MVITDQTMPEMTGLELIRNIRSVDAAVPVIICTGFSEAVTRQILRKHNIAEYLMKPVSRADLARTVDKVLNGQLP